MTKSQTKLADILINDLREDVEALHQVKLNVSINTAYLIQHIIDSHFTKVKQLCDRNDMRVPDWVE